MQTGQRRVSQVEAFEEEKIEDIESQRLLPPGCKRSLEFGEVRPAVLHGDDFAVEDRPIDRDVERGRDRGETLCPVEARPRADRHPTLVEADLQAIAVVLDFVEPVVTRGWLRSEGSKLRWHESGHRGWL